MNTNRWSLVLFGSFFSLLVWYLFYTQSIVVGLHRSEERMTEVVSLVQEMIQSRDVNVTEPRYQGDPLSNSGDFETILFDCKKLSSDQESQ